MAAPAHGIAMHGEPKYGPGFAHLDYVNPDAPKGGELRRAATGTFDSLNPFIIKGVAAHGRHHVFETLLKRTWDEPFSLYGLIAESIDVPDDRSSVAFTLRPEAHFHDGSPITVDDVIFSWETLKEQGRPNHRLYYGKVRTIERPDARTVRFVFDSGTPDRELPLILGLMPILSKAYYTSTAFEETTLTPPLGSGPYRIESVDAGRGIVYRRDPGYWGRHLPINRGQHNFDRISYDYYRDDEVMMEAFRAGEYDLRQELSAARWVDRLRLPGGGRTAASCSNSCRTGAPPACSPWSSTPARRSSPSARSVTRSHSPSTSSGSTGRCCKAPMCGRTASSTTPSSAAAACRRAANWPCWSLTAAGSRPRCSKAPTARLRWKEGSAGIWRRPGACWPRPDGSSRTASLRRAADGLPLAFEILLVNPGNEKIALAFARNLKRLGVEAKVRTVDTAQYQYRRNVYDFDMIVYRWGMSLSPGNEQAFYWGSDAAHQEGTRNYPGIEDPVVDDLIARMTQARARADFVDTSSAPWTGCCCGGTTSSLSIT